MLKDSRVKVNEPTNHGYTPLRQAAYYGHLDAIKWWIASGREIDFGKPGEIYATDAIGAAKKNGKKEVVSLLERFKSDAAKTRSEVRKELGILDFPVSTPPKLTTDQYLAFVGGKPLEEIVPPPPPASTPVVVTQQEKATLLATITARKVTDFAGMVHSESR